MEEENLIPINVILADRSYRLKVRPDEEEQVRGSIKLVNQQILEFKTAYAGKDIQDYIAMCLITYATRTEGPDSRETGTLTEGLSSLEAFLDKALA
ncbi:MAG TPA: cell division protein ZapA [Chitinophagaceae bacterium]|nr:cell division protein ZapA [Chitinophagaceae bacterium]